MRVAPTKSEGRMCEGDTPYLKYRIVDRVVEVWEPRDPRTPEQKKPKTNPLKPGNLAAIIIKMATGISTCSSGCGDFADWMNDKGWLGCLNSRRAIALRLCDEAHKRAEQLEAEAQKAIQRAATAKAAADKIDPDHAMTLVAAGIMQMVG